MTKCTYIGAHQELSGFSVTIVPPFNSREAYGVAYTRQHITSRKTGIKYTRQQDFHAFFPLSLLTTTAFIDYIYIIFVSF